MLSPNVKPGLGNIKIVLNIHTNIKFYRVEYFPLIRKISITLYKYINFDNNEVLQLANEM